MTLQTTQTIEHVQRHEPSIRRRTFPRTVLVAFVASRLAVFGVALVVGLLRDGESGLSPLLHWDFAWYSEISEHGFGVAREGGQTGWPFFPLLPAVLLAGRLSGLAPGFVGILVTNTAFLLALWGVYRLAQRRFGTSAAGWAVWGLALFPSSVTFSMVYPDPIVLAAGVWAFAFAEHRRDGNAAFLGTAATLLRPNGIVTAVALARATKSAKRAAFVMVPSVAALGVWMLLLWRWSGNPLQFVHAKAAWDEVSLWRALTDPAANIQWTDVVLVLVCVGAVAACWRRLPRGWLLLYGLAIVPSLITGMTGLARYSAACFVPAVCLGIVLARLPRWGRHAALAASTTGLLVVSAMVLTENLTP